MALSIRMDVSEFDRLPLPAQTRQLVHPYSDADACAAEIRCIKLEEALADKMKCLLQRGYCYDLFDLVYGAFIAQDIEVNRAEMLDVFLRKTIFGRSPGSARALLLDLPVDLFRGYWSKVLTPKASRFSFDEALELLKGGIDSIFGTAGALAMGVSNAFYPSHLRNLILEAGGDRKLMRVSYDGVTRIIEPYALNYKTRKDGVGQEYFYAYDRTGGRSSGAGIKTLLHSKIYDLQVLEEGFEPRFAVELGKAGDRNTAGYFTGTPGPRTATRSATKRHTRTTSGVTHIVQCPYCSKRFRRTKMSTRLNKHKDQYGNQCFGRSGMYMGTA